MVPPQPQNFLSKKHQLLHFLNHNCKSFKQLTQIHAQINKNALQKDTFLTTQLIHKCTLSPLFTNLHYAKTLLLTPQNNLPTSSWNMLIRAYANADGVAQNKGFCIYKTMKAFNVKVNELTFPFVFKISTESEGIQAHCDVIKNGLDLDLYIGNGIVSFYGGCGRVKDAMLAFDGMSMRSVVSWNSVVGACVGNGELGVGVGIVGRMRSDGGVGVDERMVGSLVSGCAGMGRLGLGKAVHGMGVVEGLGLGLEGCYVGTALVDMYGKCGEVGFMRLVFERMEVRNVWSWSAMILGLAQNGFGGEAVEVFEEMLREGLVRPNYVTFLGVICACSHARLVDDGYRYFREMEPVYGVEPGMVHYGAMVDMLGRAGRLKEAYYFVLGMPVEPDPVVWRTLLSACWIHDVEDKGGMGDAVRNRLLELEPQRSGNLVMVANMYAETGMWDKAAKLRTVMKDGGLKKVAGESCVELGGVMYKFYSGDDSEVDCKDIYDVLNVFSEHTKLAKPTRPFRFTPSWPF